MKKFILNSVKFLVFFSIGAFLFWLVYRDMNMKTILASLQNVSWGWIWLSLFFSLLSHISRAVRWNMLIEPLGHKPKIANTFFAVMVMYITNLAFPRSGEVARCGVLKKYENISFTQLIGTVLIERTADMLFLCLLLLLLMITQFGVVIEFVNNNPEVQVKVQSLFSLWWILAALGVFFTGFAVALYLMRERLKQIALYVKISGYIDNMKNGFVTIMNLKNKWRFIGHTFFMWLMYFAMTYACFFAYDPTANLPVLAGLAVLVMGGFGMVAPVQGGIGAWHFMAMETLFIYGISRPDGKIYALLTHTSMTLMLIVLGFISIAVLPLYNRIKEVSK